jgi:hypothetical protein
MLAPQKTLADAKPEPNLQLLYLSQHEVKPCPSRTALLSMVHAVTGREQTQAKHTGHGRAAEMHDGHDPLVSQPMQHTEALRQPAEERAVKIVLHC